MTRLSRRVLPLCKFDRGREGCDRPHSRTLRDQGFGLPPPSTTTYLYLPYFSGFANRKAQYIKEAAADVINKFSGDIPNTIEGLLSLKGVGPKVHSKKDAHAVCASSTDRSHPSTPTNRWAISPSSMLGSSLTGSVLTFTSSASRIDSGGTHRKRTRTSPTRSRRGKGVLFLLALSVYCAEHAYAMQKEHRVVVAEGALGSSRTCLSERHVSQFRPDIFHL